MKFKILGLPFKREEFKISNEYRGICRNEIPEPKIKKNSKVEFLNDLYIKVISSEREQLSIHDLLEITNHFTTLSTEPFELIIIKGIEEAIPDNVLYKSLGYEVIASNESSMIHFWLRRKFQGFEGLYEKNIKKINSNYLFAYIDDAESFIEDIKPYSYIISSASEISFNIFEIIHIKMVLY